MNEQEKWNYINTLEEELLLGGVILSEWSTFLAKDAELAFCSGANLAAILAAQAAIESHLRYVYFDPVQTKGWGLYHLIENAGLPNDLNNSLHKLRKYRNQWVHVEYPTQDDHLLEKPEYYEEELEEMAKLAIKSMLRVLYIDQFL
ncbi:hypothetical protein ACX27_29815 [Nostoc piscinale CENA21]|uniref:HEPN domain-containing protein n=1 Tax=Nostoc piscinale CENA21 TaxID=224013 RepID=A0A0M4TPR6_9NOSO|nr:HEPN domain-containing protein [Nostoc piscinale]ALF56099.1 hypothetical protein ACX27_29815 [Nostoc piscinale CENA21]